MVGLCVYVCDIRSDLYVGIILSTCVGKPGEVCMVGVYGSKTMERVLLRERGGEVVVFFRGTYYSEDVFSTCFPDVQIGDLRWTDVTPVSGKRTLEAYISPAEEVIYA